LVAQRLERARQYVLHRRRGDDPCCANTYRKAWIAMNAPNLNDLRQAVPARDIADEKMLQIRDLLVGDHIRETQTRLMVLETRVRDLENGLAQRLTELSHRIETLASDQAVDRHAAFDELSKCVLDLADKIRIIAR
jgi:hypothetical protein